jgi:hypothetical protein
VPVPTPIVPAGVPLTDTSLAVPVKLGWDTEPSAVTEPVEVRDVPVKVGWLTVPAGVKLPLAEFL